MQQPLGTPAFVEQALFQAEEIKIIELRSVTTAGFGMYQLMELAGRAAWDCVQKHWPEAKRLLVVCGKGNNAGDGFVLARIAASQGKIVQVLLVDIETVYQGDAYTAFSKMKQCGLVPQAFESNLLVGQDLVIDAILGTGFKGPLRKNFQEVIESVNRFSDRNAAESYGVTDKTLPILSLDIPSGLESDTGFAHPLTINANRTLTFIALKRGMVTGHARACCGEIELDPLGIELTAKNDATPTVWIDDADALIGRLPRRSKIAHKGDHGHLLLVGGDFGLGGAILMAAMAAARCGAGKLTILTRDVHVAPILTQCPEAMIRSIDGADDPALEKIMSSVDAVVIGPGLGQEEWGKGLLSAVCNSDLPLLVDADALNILAKHGHCISQDRIRDHWVITPHPGEAERLLGQSISDIEQDRYWAVDLLQKKYSCVAVLKGAGTLIACNNRFTTVCNEGNPGMASAGMGDILSGIIGTLLAQGVPADMAARTGVALHARAGDLAAMNGQKGLMATDLIGPLRMLVNQ